MQRTVLKSDEYLKEQVKIQMQWRRKKASNPAKAPDILGVSSLSTPYQTEHNFRMANERVTNVCRTTKSTSLFLSLSLFSSLSLPLSLSPRIFIPLLFVPREAPTHQLENSRLSCGTSPAVSRRRSSGSTRRGQGRWSWRGRSSSKVVETRTDVSANNRREWSTLWCSVSSRMISVRSIISW